MKHFVADVVIDDDEVNDLDNKEVLHLNDGFDGIEDTEFNMNRIINNIILVVLLKMKEINMTILVVLIKRTKTGSYCQHQ